MLAIVPAPWYDAAVWVSGHRSSLSGYFIGVDPTKFSISGRFLDQNQVNYELITQWLDICKAKHTCRRNVGGTLPGLRVIDCETREIVPLKDVHVLYVALSYIWGSAVAATMQIGTRIPTSVDLVIEDAMKVTVQLRFRYLWVDRYCIPELDAAEKHRQICGMGVIYSNAALTIIAAAGDSPDYGLPGVSSRRRTPQPDIQIGTHRLVSTMPDIEIEISKSK